MSMRDGGMLVNIVIVLLMACLCCVDTALQLPVKLSLSSSNLAINVFEPFSIAYELENADESMDIYVTLTSSDSTIVDVSYPGIVFPRSNKENGYARPITCMKGGKATLNAVTSSPHVKYDNRTMKNIMVTCNEISNSPGTVTSSVQSSPVPLTPSASVPLTSSASVVSPVPSITNTPHSSDTANNTSEESKGIAFRYWVFASFFVIIGVAVVFQQYKVQIFRRIGLKPSQRNDKHVYSQLNDSGPLVDMNMGVY